MTNNKPQKHTQTSHPTDSIATGLGAAGGGVAGSTLGRSLGGKVAAAIGGVADAIAGGMTGNMLNKAIELPRHYSWAELQALSKFQGGKIQNS